MSEYKRFLSYIYAYDGNIRAEGTGFVKTELRDDKYRLQVNLNCMLPSKAQGYHVGIYNENEGVYELCELGAPEIKNGRCGFEMTGFVKDFAFGKIDLSSAKGIVIYREAGSRIHMTCWNDPPVMASDVRNLIFAIKDGWASISKPLEVSEQEEEVRAATSNLSILIGSIKEDEPEEKNYTEENISEEIKTEEIKREVEAAEVKADLEKNECKPEDKNEAYKHIDEEDEEALKYDNTLKAGEALKEWEDFKRAYPKLKAFKEEGWEVLEIKLQTIGMLPRENWILGNNNFVLHGFYRHGYLILARRHKQDIDDYIVGVPGIFSINEKFIATMFGMTEFMEADIKKPDTPKNFGYWCTHVSI